jgi:hypothetical protein
MKTILCLKTSNFKIIELSGGPYPTWEQIALPNAAKKNMAVTCIITSNTAPFSQYSFNYDSS